MGLRALQRSFEETNRRSPRLKALLPVGSEPEGRAQTNQIFIV
jgi:hypothetical protein